MFRLQVSSVSSSKRLRGPSDFRVDGRWEDHVVAVKHQPRALREVQGALLRLAMYLDAEPAQRGVLLLVEPWISEERLRNERTKALSVLREELRARLLVVAQRGGSLDGLPADADPGLATWLAEVASAESGRRTGVRLKRPSAESQVLELLVQRWMLGVGPVTTKSLEQDSGFSYPAVAAALHRLQPVLRRASDRRVELDRFPREDWARLVAGAQETRSTLWFVDRSGQPRSPDALRSRLQKLDRDDLALAGTDGARHHVPDLDVVGTPWMSLALHCPQRRADLRFVRRLDPALERRAVRSDEPPSLVIHCVQRPQTEFHRGGGGTLWADPVACLLDLHEMRLEAQASELVAHFAARRAESPS